MLTAISADFGDFRRQTTDELPRFRIEMSRRDTRRRLFAATENQGVASSNLALGTIGPLAPLDPGSRSVAPIEVVEDPVGVAVFEVDLPSVDLKVAQAALATLPDEAIVKRDCSLVRLASHRILE